MDSFVIAGRTFRSRLIVGTGKYKSSHEAARAIEASGANRMIRTTTAALFRLAGLVLPLVLLFPADCAAQKAGKWSVTQLSTNLSDEIGLSDGTKSRAMSVEVKYLEIRALFSSSDENSLSLGTDQITVTGAVGDGVIIGVGIPGPKGACVYTFALGFNGAATGQATTGDGYRLERKENMPKTLTLLKNRSSLCLAFGIQPEVLQSLQKAGKFKLTFGDATVRLPEPGKK